MTEATPSESAPSVALFPNQPMSQTAFQHIPHAPYMGASKSSRVRCSACDRELPTNTPSRDGERLCTDCSLKGR